jgi:hypothetical protein
MFWTRFGAKFRLYSTAVKRLWSEIFGGLNEKFKLVLDFGNKKDSTNFGKI